MKTPTILLRWLTFISVIINVALSDRLGHLRRKGKRYLETHRPAEHQ